MNRTSVHPPLSNIQVELLKLFPTDIPEKHLKELRKVIARFLLEKARDKADEIWDKQGYSDDQLLNILNENEAVAKNCSRYRLSVTVSFAKVGIRHSY